MQATPEMEKVDEVVMEDFLKHFGIEQTPKLKQHLRVFVDCLSLYAERDGRYVGLWKHRGWLGNLFHMDHKMARLMRLFWEQENVDADPDDAYDLINYTAFFLRNHNAGNRLGASSGS